MENNKAIIAGLVALIVVVGGIFAFAGGDSDDDAANSETNTSQTSQSSSAADDADEAEEAESTIVELAQATPTLSTLVTAVVEAELVDTLSSVGPFTVLAPTDEAFGNALAALDITAEELLARSDLGDILTYHVISGEVEAADLSDGQVVTTVQGGTLTVGVSGGTVTFTDANGGVATVASADIDASNGVVHVIDTVLLP